MGEEDLGVISMMEGDEARSTQGDSKEGMGAEPGAEGLGNEEVQDWRERATLAYTSHPFKGRGVDTVGKGGGKGVEKEELGPVDHAGGGTHGRHDAIEEKAVDGVEGLGDIQEDKGSSLGFGFQGGGEEGGKEDVVCNLTMGEEGRLLGSDCWGEGGGKAGGKDLGKDAVDSGEEGNGS